MESSQSNQVETNEKAYGKDAAAVVKRWVAEIDLYEEEFEDYHTKCAKILERYRDERKTEGENSKLPRCNGLWANNKVIEPSIYSQRAKLDASRRFHDRDPIGRLSCEIIERAHSTSVDDDRYDFDGVMVRARQDFELLARGVVWERYEPVFVSGQVTDDKTGQVGEEQEPQERLVYEHVCTEHLHYEDFGHTSGARAWEEVSAVWRKAYMTREELEKRFTDKLDNGLTVGADVKLDYCPKRILAKKDDSSKYSHFKKAIVYEIWDRATGKVYWINKEYPTRPLDMQEDTLGLRGFFPCPKPAYGTVTNDSLVPVPDFTQVQDLANELDVITARISLITNAIQAKGVYEKSLAEQGLARLLKGGDLEMLPVDLARWQGLAGGGDLRKLIMWAPNEMLVAVLNVLYDARDRTKALLDEYSGAIDLQRGANDPRATATAEQGKMNYQSRRMETKVSEFARFVRDLYRIKVEIICEKFRPETIAAMVGFDPQKSVQDLTIPQIPMPQQAPMMPGQPPQPPQMMPPEMVFQQALELMRNDTMRAYRIDIETDSTIALDQQMEQQKAGEFLQNIGQFFSNVGPIIQQIPAFGKPMGNVLLATARRYKFGRAFEDGLEIAIDEALNTIAQQAQQQPQADPAMMKVQQDGQLKQASDQAKMMVEQEKLKLKGAELQQRGAIAGQELALRRDIAMTEAAQKEKQIASEMHIKELQTVTDMMGKQEERRAQFIGQAAEMEGAEQERQHRMKMAEKQANKPQGSK